jgi:hypothetical protein
MGQVGTFCCGRLALSGLLLRFDVLLLKVCDFMQTREDQSGSERIRIS